MRALHISDNPNLYYLAETSENGKNWSAPPLASNPLSSVQDFKLENFTSSSRLPLLIFMHDVTILTRNEDIGAATATRIEWLVLVVAWGVPVASFWVRMVTSCMNINRGVWWFLCAVSQRQNKCMTTNEATTINWLAPNRYVYRRLFIRPYMYVTRHDSGQASSTILLLLIFGFTHIHLGGLVFKTLLYSCMGCGFESHPRSHCYYCCYYYYYYYYYFYCYL